jgi:hypothetical protein
LDWVSTGAVASPRVVIERVSWRQPRYAVLDDAGHGGSWTRRRFGEAMRGEIDGTSFELRRDGTDASRS